ncbi:MAG TPA: sodium:calcium antiporter [Nannocystis exedens]|nr:sodium:calcium antiporter [Nannocystis exedens]
MSILLYAALALLSTALIWRGSKALESSAKQLSRHYELPEIVHGAVVIAVGSSFPELTTTLLSTIVHGEFELGAAAIVGSAIFNILVIPGIAGLVAPEELRITRDLVYKEAQFYMLAVALLLLSFSLAVIYHPIDPDTTKGTLLGIVDRELAMLPLGGYLLYLFLQYQDTVDVEAAPQVQAIRPVKQWLILLLSLLLIVIGVEGLVRSALAFGEILHTPSFLWGLTVVAIGTSVPDAFLSVRAARAGNPTICIANVLGSNTFDLLVAIPAGIMIAGTATINFSLAGPLIAVLALSTVLLFMMMRTGMVLTRRESAILLALYVAFVLWISLESFALIDLVQGLRPSHSGSH